MPLERKFAVARAYKASCLSPQLYKIEVNNGSETWIIYRRYGDFVLLNKKVIRNFCLINV